MHFTHRVRCSLFDTAFLSGANVPGQRLAFGSLESLGTRGIIAGIADKASCNRACSSMRHIRASWCGSVMLEQWLQAHYPDLAVP